MTVRVCLVTSEYPPVIGGIASHVFELARAIAAASVEATVVHPISLMSPPPPPPEAPGVAVFRPRLVKAQPLYDFVLRLWLRGHLAKGKFDLVHVHGVRPLAATRGLSLPVVFTNHTSGFLGRLNAEPGRKRRTAALLEHVDALLAPSDELVAAARAFGYAGPAQMIPNGVDIERFAPGPSGARAAWGFGADETVIMLARRLVKKNGVLGFARAVARMQARNFRVVVAGDGPDREQMVEILGEAGMLDRVKFLGAVPNSSMPEIYRACDVAVLPSLAEATSITGLEAMACGLPLVGTNVGGIPAIVADGVSGLLVPPADPEALAGALGRLIDSPGLRRTMGEAGRRSAEETFSWPIIARRTAEAYEACLSRRSGRRVAG
jgi:glycosyltransferase involved in cell wall biosynthesis